MDLALQRYWRLLLLSVARIGGFRSTVSQTRADAHTKSSLTFCCCVTAMSGLSRFTCSRRSWMKIIHADCGFDCPPDDDDGCLVRFR